MTTDNEPVHTVTYFEIAPAASGDVAQSLRQWAPGARTSEGCSRIDVLQRTGPSHHFALVATWASRKHYEAARDGAGGQGLRAHIGPHLICGIDTRIHNALIGGADAMRGQAALVAVIHIDVPPPNKDACIGLLETHVKASRAEPGCARFEVFQQADRPNHFSAVEGWASQSAYDTHIVSSHTRQFRTQLTPLSGALYDERIYKAIA